MKTLSAALRVGWVVDRLTALKKNLLVVVDSRDKLKHYIPSAFHEPMRALSAAHDGLCFVILSSLLSIELAVALSILLRRA